MTARPRVDCPVCGRRRTVVNVKGTIRRHRDRRPDTDEWWYCPASDKLTAEDARKADLAQLQTLVRRYPKEARDFVASLP